MRKLYHHSESEIVLLIKQGDKLAFDELYQRYVDKTLGFADAFIGDTDEAEDVVQVIFVSIWENRQRLDPEKKIGAYLFQSVKNNIFNRLRDIKKRCSLSEIPEESQLDQQDTLRKICQQEILDQVLESIREMPGVQQKVFLLSKIEGLSNNEIAEKLKLSKRTVEHHLYLGKKFFKNKNLDKAIFFIALVDIYFNLILY